MMFSVENVITILATVVSIVEAIWIYSQRQTFGQVVSRLDKLDAKIATMDSAILQKEPLDNLIELKIARHKEYCAGKHLTETHMIKA